MWADFVAWLGSPGGARVIQSAVIPALAVLVAGAVAALIGRSAARSALAGVERERARAAVVGLVEAANAATQGAATGAERRRIARLRAEGDVRTRMLGLPGSDLAADWAAERTRDAVAAAQTSPEDAEAAVSLMRDRLVRWTRQPKRARRLFVVPPAAAEPPQPRRRGTAQQEAPQPEPQPARSAPPAVNAAEDETPAAPPAPAAAVADEEAHTAPVLTQHTRRTFAPAAQPERTEAPAAVVPKAAEPDRRAAARHARPSDDQPAVPVSAPTGSVQPVSAPPASAPPQAAAETARAKPGKPAVPAWLDTYDDEAQVTQNLDLSTPPPVAASAVRDRAPSGADIVPRG